MLLLLSVNDQSELLKSLLVGDQCLDRVMFCLKPFDFNDFSFETDKIFSVSLLPFCVKI